MIARFTTIDPVAEHFPWLTNYQYGSNNPSSKKDLDGLEGISFQFDLFFEESAIIPKSSTSGAGYSAENIARAGGDVATKSTQNLSRAANFARGNQAEAEQLAKNGLEKNTQPLKGVDPKTGKGGTTIPDALENDGKSTFEVKNVKQQSLTEQLRLQEKISNDNGFRPKLDINEGAKLSTPLKNSKFDIKTYESAPVTLKSDATKTVRPPIVPPSKGPWPTVSFREPLI